MHYKFKQGKLQKTCIFVHNVKEKLKFIQKALMVRNLDHQPLNLVISANEAEKCLSSINN